MRNGRFPLKCLEDGLAMLNVACGTRMHWGWNNVDFTPYARLRRHPCLAVLGRRLGIIGAERYRRLEGVDPGITHWDVRRGIPFADGTFDVVYHSHFLEHVEREAAPVFLRETLRVLKPGGTTRVVVPDLKVLVDRYLESWEALERSGGDGMASHRASIHELFDQMVRRELTGAAHQPGPLRALERRLRGDAAGAGELHRWMYDRHTLVALLESVGFSAVKVERADTSRIPGWNEYRLDTEPDGRVYKPESLFVEASKP